MLGKSYVRSRVAAECHIPLDRNNTDISCVGRLPLELQEILDFELLTEELFPRYPLLGFPLSDFQWWPDS